MLWKQQFAEISSKWTPVLDTKKNPIKEEAKNKFPITNRLTSPAKGQTTIPSYYKNPEKNTTHEQPEESEFEEETERTLIKKK